MAFSYFISLSSSVRSASLPPSDPVEFILPPHALLLNSAALMKIDEEVALQLSPETLMYLFE